MTKGERVCSALFGAFLVAIGILALVQEPAMKVFRPWVTAVFLWLPLILSVLLNPGRDGSNIGGFSHAELLVLALCGVSMMLYGALGLLQPRALAFVFPPFSLAPARILLMLSALASGALVVYQSYEALSAPR